MRALEPYSRQNGHIIQIVKAWHIKDNITQCDVEITMFCFNLFILCVFTPVLLVYKSPDFRLFVSSYLSHVIDISIMMMTGCI